MKFTLLHNHLNYGAVGVRPPDIFSYAPRMTSGNGTSNSNSSSSLFALNNSTTNETNVKLMLAAEPILQPTYSVALVDGRTPFEGRLRVEINAVSGTVCSRGWSLLNSRIVCAQLGLVLDPTMYLFSRWLGETDWRRSEPILMSEVQCDPLDTSIFECRHTRRTDHTCTHQDDVWIRCVRPGWAGVRFGMNAERARLKYAVFEGAGQYDYAKSQLAPALQFDLMHNHVISNVTFQGNEFTSMEVILTQPLPKPPINNLYFVSNRGAGIFLPLTCSLFMKSIFRNSPNNQKLTQKCFHLSLFIYFYYLTVKLCF